MTEGDEQLTPVYLTTAVRTSRGPGPGVLYLPLAEAGALVGRRLAVHGTQPPHGFGGPGGAGAASNASGG